MSDVKYPHPMYDPKTGKKVMAKTPADHNKFAKMGYTHEAPKTEDTTTASIPNPADTAMGPRFKTGRVHDRRKKKGAPLLLKRFRDYYTDKGIM